MYIVKGFGVINKAEVDIFLEFSYFFYDSMDVGNLISDSSAFSKSSLNIWKFTVCILLKPGLENFKHYFASVWDECNYTVVWTFFGIFCILGLISINQKYDLCCCGLCIFLSFSAQTMQRVPMKRICANTTFFPVEFTVCGKHCFILLLQCPRLDIFKNVFEIIRAIWICIDIKYLLILLGVIGIMVT